MKYSKLQVIHLDLQYVTSQLGKGVTTNQTQLLTLFMDQSSIEDYFSTVHKIAACSETNGYCHKSSINF